MNWRCLLMCLSTATGIMAGSLDPKIQLNTKGSQLCHSKMGPFVTRADGKILTVGKTQAEISGDEGKTWRQVELFPNSDKFSTRPERALIRTKSGVTVFAFLNEKEKKLTPKTPPTNYLPTYVVRSLDDGETWEKPVWLQGEWCGAVRQIIQLKSGRLLMPCQNSLYNPWRHVSFSFVSDDDGKTWKRSNVIELKGVGDHGGAMEPTAIELKDGRVYMLIRTSVPELGKIWFWEAYSSDGGLTWDHIKKSDILASTCCGTLSRLGDGRICLLWNRPEEGQPYNAHTRAELAFAFSTDECQTWTRPVVMSRRPLSEGEPYYKARQSYPYLYEKEPGKLWITTMQGGLRMQIATADIPALPPKTRKDYLQTIIALGSSTTAYRHGVKEVYSQQLERIFPDFFFINAGVGGDTTAKALQRFDKDVLAQKPDIVIIQLGGNDAAIDVWRNVKTPRVSPQDYRKNLVKMVDQLQERKIKVILMTAGMFRWTEKLRGLYGKPPYNPQDPDGFNLMLRPYADIVREVAKEKHTELADLFKAHEAYDAVDGQSIDDLFLDGMHPNDKGHKLATDLLIPVIKRLTDK